MGERPWETRQDYLDSVEREKQALAANKATTLWARWTAIGAIVTAVATVAALFK